jgi:hypothetical protein
MYFSNNTVLTLTASARVVEQLPEGLFAIFQVHSPRLYKYGAKLGPFSKNR